MKKSLLFLSTLILVIICFAGCGKKTDPFYDNAQLIHYSDYLIYLQSVNVKKLPEYKVSIETTVDGKKSEQIAQVSLIDDGVCVHLQTSGEEISEAYLVGDVMYIAKGSQKLKSNYSPSVENTNSEIEPFRILFKKILNTYSNVEAMKPSYFIDSTVAATDPKMPLYRKDCDNTSEFRIKIDNSGWENGEPDKSGVYFEERVYFIYNQNGHDFDSIEVFIEDFDQKTNKKISVKQSSVSFSIPNFEDYVEI